MPRILLAVALATALGLAGTAFAAGSDALYPSQLLENKPALKSQYRQLVQSVEADHAWVRSMGTQTPVSKIKLGDKTYAVLSGCKPHDCPSQGIVALMAPDSDQAVGAFVVNQGEGAMGPKASKITWLGDPGRAQRRFIAAYLFR